MTENEWRRAVALACDRHGPMAVSDAAYRAMAGDGGPLAALGLQTGARNLPALHLATTIAYRLMGPDEQAADLAAAVVDAAKLPAAPGAAPPLPD